MRITVKVNLNCGTNVIFIVLIFSINIFGVYSKLFKSCVLQILLLHVYIIFREHVVILEKTFAKLVLVLSLIKVNKTLNWLGLSFNNLKCFIKSWVTTVEGFISLCCGS
ncbi:hypothetical protein MRV_0104 [Murid herpesvirus 3]|uniref:Uncharacterized protein n=2 Tax=Murid betaherpesvirus 3 TaxID=2560603 RepID=A0A1P8VJ00_9BETA|nr:hypothetical protein MRV_0104 [Murine roseolovirus]APZ76315.1 hypothetical protein MRV_0104 [Murid betaherpesvirus 3]AYH64815.1 hypothetical protein MRV_0104 [Murid herpesvirus 3]